MRGRACIRIESGFYEGLEWPLDRARTIIGRGSTADLVLNEATISRAHAVFAFKGEKLQVQDMGSTNGTLVNGASEQLAPLNHNDEIKMGRLVLRVVLTEEAAQ